MIILANKNEFKQFIKGKPELVDYIKSGDMTWQKFYEIYDLYGADRGVWDKYIPKVAEKVNGMDKIGDLIKNVDMDSIQNHINTAQKALGFVQELTTKKPSNLTNIKGPSSPRPINKFFED